MPELRWTLLLLGALFIAVLAWSERRKARQSTRLGHEPTLPEAPVSRSSREVREPAIREPTLTLPELRAREPAPPQDLPVVHVEDESLVGLRLEGRKIEPEMSPGALASPATGGDSDPEWEVSAGPDPSVPDLPVLVAAETTELEVESTEQGEPLEAPSARPDERPARASYPEAASARMLQPEASHARPGYAEGAGSARPGYAEGAGSARPGHAEGADFARAGHAEGAGSARPGHAEGADSAATSDPEASLAPMPEPDVGPAPAAPSSDSGKAPIVDWPPEEDRRIIALRLVSVSPERFSGRAIRTALAAEGFVHGKFAIFHKPDARHRAVLSAASLSKPGVFDLETIDSQRFSGLNLFAVLSGNQSAREPFELLLACARNLNERLEGGLQDDRGGPLTPSRLAALRESLGAAPAPLS